MSMIGKKFNHLTIIGPREIINTRPYYDCKCDCGNKRVIKVREDGLKSGNTKSCGCTRSSNILGQQFGSLKVISRIEKYNKKNYKRIFWECICKCGKKVITRIDRLKDNSACRGCARIVDITGNIYGKLTALNIDYNFRIKAKWFCLCECGNITSTRSASLINGATKSCGCCKLIAENELLDGVEEILPGKYVLKRHHYTYFLGQQHVDGAIFKNNVMICGIEYDGKQHFELIECWGGKEGLRESKKRDKKKNKKFRDNNIPLIRFSYKEVITKELIMKKLKKAGIL